jgi:hypothetical protein
MHATFLPAPRAALAFIAPGAAPHKIKVDGLSVVWPQNHSDGFCRFDFSSGWASKPLVTVYEWFGLKTTRTVFAGLASKPMVTVSHGLASKSAATVSSGLASKPIAMVFMVWPQNQWRRFSPVWPQNWWQRFLLVWPQNRRSVSWLSLKTKVVEGFPVWAIKPTTLVW